MGGMEWVSDCGRARLFNADCRLAMAGLEAESVDSIVCDPPYGLSFMGKGWDHGVPGVEFWVEALRVAKPGAHLLAFGGTRTYHRLACAIEDAGWEIRDCLMWVYGSGFPKSLDVSKAIDKQAGHWRVRANGVATVNGSMSGPNYVRTDKGLPITDLAVQWQGWGTALKPAWEPIIMARKPLISTVAENVLRHGTGGINVDACRVGFHGESDKAAAAAAAQRSCQDQNKNRTAYGKFNNGEASLEPYLNGLDKGRWPANLIHDGSDEVVGLFPKTGPAKAAARGGTSPNPMNWGCGRSDGQVVKGHNDNGGSAARFFYVPKASKADRDEGCDGLALVTHESGIGGAMPVDDKGNAMDRFKAQRRNHHPTVKPTALMRYLCRLVTPPGGIVLDLFTGSGSTGKAAILEGFRFIGTELEAEYFEIAKARISCAIANYQPPEGKPSQLSLLPDQP